MKKLMVLPLAVLLLLASCTQKEILEPLKDSRIEEIGEVKKLSDNEYYLQAESTMGEIWTLVNREYGNAHILTKKELLRSYDELLYKRIEKEAGVIPRSVDQALLKAQWEHQPDSTSSTTVYTATYIFFGPGCPSSTVFAYAETKIPKNEGDYRYLTRTQVRENGVWLASEDKEYEVFNFNCNHKVDLQAISRLLSDCTYTSAREVNCDD